MVLDIIAHIKLASGTERAHSNIDTCKDHKYWLIKRAMVVLRMVCKGKRSLKKYGGIELKHHNLLRNAFTFMASCYDNQSRKEIRDEPRFSAITNQWELGRVLAVEPSGYLQQRAGETIKKLLSTSLMARIFKPKIAHVHRIHNFIGDRIKDKSICRDAKLDLLRMIWDKVAN